MYETRKYLVIPSSIVDDINFSQVHETSKDTLRYSVDGTKTFVKYDLVIQEEDVVHNSLNMETGETITTTVSAGIYGRPSIYDESYTECTHEQILELLSTDEWTKKISYPPGDPMGE
jgi:hypothetical protein